MIVMLMGLPGTGKSTFAKALAHSLGAKHINSDQIRSELGRRGNYKLKSKWLVYQEMALQMLRHMQFGRSVVLDATFSQADWREYFVMLADPQPIYLIELTAPESVIENRLQQKRPFTDANYPVYELIKKEYEPEATEHLRLDSSQMQLGKMINQALQYLKVGQYEPQ
jgi:predicted kinase